MKTTTKNIEQLKQLGFKEINPKKLVYKDVTAYMPLDGTYIFFKYCGKELPIISEISTIKKLLEGIYEYENFNSIGVELIADERKRQIEVEGWTAEHDSEHKDGQLANAAAYYAMTDETISFIDNDWGNDMHLHIWPFDLKWLKRNPNDRVQELVKAGALIAAEIDRLKIDENDTRI
jgi:hypothetical protein